MWRTVKQAFKEYWLAFVVGLLWAAYVGGLNSKLSVYISNFAGSFFLTSWALGQINRIKRDHATKEALTALDTSIANLNARLAALDLSTATISRWTATAKAYVPTPEVSAAASTTTLQTAPDNAQKPENDVSHNSDSVINFNKYQVALMRRQLTRHLLVAYLRNNSAPLDGLSIRQAA
jgi:hypothetical protein